MDHTTCHEAMAASAVASPFLQIFSLGFVWVYLHCAPMCGPILSGLQIQKDLHPVYALTFYQMGRGLIYVLMGALAGGIGAAFQPSPLWGWVVVAILGFLFAYQAFPQWMTNSVQMPGLLIKLASRGNSLSGWKRPFVLGLIFAFLPCMLVFWALTLASSTNSIFEGALAMLCLLLMTTLPLLSVTWGFSRFIRGKQKQISLWLLGFSLLWTLLFTSAANLLIPHLHWAFSILGQEYKLMFW